MFVRIRKFLESRLASYVVVIYGLGNVLGYGLHGLSDCQHCHHGRVSCSINLNSYEYRQNFDLAFAQAFNAEQEPTADSPLLKAIEDDCAICAFLAQAQTPVQSHSGIGIVEDVTAEIPVSERIAPLFLPSEHLARGPPVC